MSRKCLFSIDVHGASTTPEGRSWRAMLHRCYNPNNNRYHLYGARGIKVDPDLLSFKRFLEVMGKKPSIKHTIDRIDVNKDYTPDNIRWATSMEQGRNTRRNVFIVFEGKRQILKDWAKDLNLSYKNLHLRLKAGWSIRRAFTTPEVYGSNQYSKTHSKYHADSI